MEFKKILVTPTVAKKYLEANIKNRVVKSVVVLRYAQEMLNDRWKSDTAEVIKISKSGVVLDGQHRLLAVIKANKPVYFHVAFDVDEDVFDVLDTGSKRNAGDAFHVQGIKNANVVPSIIQTYHLLQGEYLTKAQIHQRLSHAELLEQYYKREFFWQSVGAQCHNWYKAFAKILPPSIIGGMYAYLYDKDKNDAEIFMTQLTTGINVNNTSISILRQKLMQDKMSSKKMSMQLKLALMLKTWNYYRKGYEVKLLKFDTDRDSFPIAI